MSYQFRWPVPNWTRLWDKPLSFTAAVSNWETTEGKKKRAIQLAELSVLLKSTIWMLQTCVALFWATFETGIYDLHHNVHYPPKYREQESTREISDFSDNLGQNQEQNFCSQALTCTHYSDSWLDHILYFLLSRSAATNTCLTRTENNKEKRKVEESTTQEPELAETFWFNTYFQNNPRTVDIHRVWIPYLWVHLLTKVCL